MIWIFDNDYDAPFKDESNAVEKSLKSCLLFELFADNHVLSMFPLQAGTDQHRNSGADISKTKNVFKLLKTPSCRALRVLLGNVFKSGKILKRIVEKTIFTKKK